MSTELVTTFMATLLLLGWAGVGLGVGRRDLAATVREGSVQIAAAVAVLATLSSLYLSEIADYVPCQYCWWQRIFMYPLAIMLPIAAFTGDRTIRRYAVPLAGIGLAISVRHVWLQAFPDDNGTCGVSAPCSAKLVEAYGFLTIPQMTGLCFALILVLLTVFHRSPEEPAQ